MANYAQACRIDGINGHPFIFRGLWGDTELNTVFV
ncbi:hypothetical protein SEEM1594_22740 [Salmonella enterica subsp. enterica serovar Muenchen str. baa1594]|nr:hypothetical protein SEEM1594_22740 [Salmonella enterica subsp. enterica serovar Muenchen str. baa1594]